MSESNPNRKDFVVNPWRLKKELGMTDTTEEDWQCERCGWSKNKHDTLVCSACKKPKCTSYS